jgi:predicted AAA+ superfamily ATPase
VFHELRAFMDYNRCGGLHYWRSISGFEVDFIVGETMAVEIKGKENVSSGDLKGLVALKEEKLLKDYIVVSLEDRPRVVDGIQILPWRIFLEKLWGREFV